MKNIMLVSLLLGILFLRSVEIDSLLEDESIKILRVFTYQDTIEQTKYFDVVLDFISIGFQDSLGNQKYSSDQRLVFLRQKDNPKFIFYMDQQESLIADIIFCGDDDSLLVNIAIYACPQEMEHWLEYAVYFGIDESLDLGTVFLKKEDILDFVASFQTVRIFPFVSNYLVARNGSHYSYQIWEIYRE
jgi:hypothetical protein